MAWPTYDEEAHKAGGDEYLDWLKSWNVDTAPFAGQAPAQTDDTVEAQADKPEPEPVKDHAPDAPAQGDDYDDRTNEELREELELRELSKSGNKAEMIERLRADDEAGDE